MSMEKLNKNLESIGIKMINVLRVKCHATGCQKVIPTSICECNKYRTHKLDTTTSIVWQSAMRIMTLFGELQKGEIYLDSFKKALDSIAAYRNVCIDQQDTIREERAYNLVDLSLQFVENLKLYMQSETLVRLSDEDYRLQFLLNLNNIIGKCESISHLDDQSKKIERIDNEQGTSGDNGEVQTEKSS